MVDSGVLSCQAGILAYESKRLSWILSVSDIRLIGEYTTANGPYIDDYFFVFLTAIEGGWHEASFYALGGAEALHGLGEELGAILEPGLCNSAHYKTRIMWPSNWRGQELMKVAPQKNTGLIPRILSSGSFDIIPSKAMREVFGE